MSTWKTLSSTVVYDNPYMTVHEDAVINPGGKEVIYGYVDSKNDSIYIVPIDDSGNTYLVQQHRYPINADSWECVAGRLMDGETPIVAARRELLEEAGLEASTVRPIGHVQIANGISTFKSSFFIATGLRKITDQLDTVDGIIAAQRLKLSEVVDKILNGNIQCSQSIAAFLMADAYLKREAQL